MASRPKLKLDRFQRTALATTAATYALIAVGGLVRASGSGLGCPDWPKCFGRWIPPLSASDVPPNIDPALFNLAKTWTEYLNRLVGVAVGFLIFATLILAILNYRKTARVLVPTAIAFVLVAFEGWLGGKVVTSRLKPLVLTVHLTFALIIAGLLVYATVSAFFPGGKPRAELPKERITLGRIALAVALLTLAQIGLGAMVRGEVQLAGTLPIPLPRAQWLDNVGPVLLVHRSFALLDAFAVGFLAWYVHARADRDRWLSGVADLGVVLVILQAAAGFGLVSGALPPALQVAHLWIGSLLLGAQLVLCLLAYRIDPRRASVDTRDDREGLLGAKC